MSTPRSRAPWVRGVLVGVCSAVVTAGAHTAAGGGVPQGATLLMAVLVCATVGAVAASVRVDGRYTGPLLTIAALGMAQLFGHLVLVAAGGHHHGGDSGPAGAMLAAHVASAVLLGAAIAAAEFLYVVCASVLCWLRLFAAAATKPGTPSRRGVATDLVVQTVLRCAGLGMRAPPAGFAASR